MGIIRALQNAVARASDSLKIGWSQPPARTTELWLDQFHKSPMLDPLDMIASSIAQTPYGIYNKVALKRDPKNAEPFDDHAIYDLLNHPMPDHPEIDYFQLMYVTIAWYGLTGDAFWLIDRDGSGRPAGVFPIPPSWVLLTPSANIPQFRIQPMGNTSHRYFNADPSDVVWFKAPNLSNPYGRGRGRAEPMGDEIETHEFSSKYAKKLFYNDATPPVILEMPGATDAQAKAIKENWMQKLGGFLNARKPGIVTQKDFKVHQLATSPKEMDFTESRKYLIQMANEHWCVPPEMRGNITNSNRATIDSANYLWTKNVVTKYLYRIAFALNNQFVHLFDKNSEWKFDEIVPEDEAFRLNVLNQGLAAGVVTRNEWRVGMGFEPDTARGDVYLTGAMTIEVPAFKHSSEPEPPPEPEKADLDAVVKDIEHATAGLKYSKHMKLGYTEDQLSSVWKSFDKRAASTEQAYKDAVKKTANAQLKKIKSAIAGGATPAEAVKKTFAGKTADTALRDALMPAWGASIKAGRDQLKSMVGTKAADNTDALIASWGKKYGLTKAGYINDTTEDQLEAALEGVTDPDVAESAIETVFDSLIDVRAVLIAQTESAGAVNYGTKETAKSEGAQTKTWVATRDDRTRDDHADADGQTVNIDDPFIVGDDELDYPGDPSGSPDEICNCRCTILVGAMDALAGGDDE